MRLVGALLVAITILLGLQAFFSLRNNNRPALPPRTFARTSQEFTVRVTLTFDAAADAFALTDEDQVALVIESQGERLFAQRDPIAAGTSVDVPLGSRAVGINELFVRATVSPDAPQLQRAMRVQVLRGGSLVIAAASIWSEPGDPVQGTVRFEAVDEPTIEAAAEGEA